MQPGRIAAGVSSLAFIAVLIGGAFFGLIWEGFAAGFSAASLVFDMYVLRIMRFTLWQAALSTLLSIIPALLVARAFVRHPSFPGRQLILQLFAVPLALPAIVAVLGLLALYGRAGFVSPFMSSTLGHQWPGIYGLSGILLAHVFFNLPMATRLFLAALENIPPHHWRLSTQLGMGAMASFRFIEGPVLRSVLPGVAGLVFMLCVTSFTIVLTLGGGPRATTLEVAIYQALRFDFDPPRAVVLTMDQLALTALMLWILTRLGMDLSGDAQLATTTQRTLFPRWSERISNAGIITLAAMFVGAPMGAVVIGGLEADLLGLISETAVQNAAILSLILASAAALITICLAFGMVMARRALELRRGRQPARFLEQSMDGGAMMVLIIPPIVIGAGWFMLLRHTGEVFRMAPAMVVVVNAIMALPFAIRIMRPAYDAASSGHERLCASLGILGFKRFRLIDWPVMRRSTFLAFAFAMALSLGDLGVIALFGSDQVQTLPYLLLQRMGSYRTQDAAGLALIIGVLCLALLFVSSGARRIER